MIIVAGHLRVADSERDALVERSLAAVKLARETPGCADFAVGPDPVESDRVNVYERWERRADLQRFRGNGPGGDLSALILSASVEEYETRSE